MMMGPDNEVRQLFQQALQKDSDQLRGLDEKLRAAQKELLGTVLATNYDEKAAHVKAEAVSKIQTELTLLRAKALASVVPNLNPEQRQQLAESPFASMMLNGGGPGMMGGRGFPGGHGPGGMGFPGGGPGGPGFGGGGFPGGGAPGDRGPGGPGGPEDKPVSRDR